VQEELKIRIRINANTGRLEVLNGEFDNLNRNVRNSNNSLTSMNSLIGAIGAGFAFTSIIDATQKFEDSLAKLSTISKATAENTATMRAEAEKLAGHYKANEVADAMTYLAMAGFKTNQILEATPSILNLSRVGLMDLALASDIASDTLTAFG